MENNLGTANSSLGNGVVAPPSSALPPAPPVETGDEQEASSAAPANASATGLLARATRSKTVRKIHKVVQRGGSSIRRPQKTEWFRTRPGWAASVYLVEDQGETYVVSEDVADELGDRCSEATLYCSINLTGDVFVLPVKAGDHLASTSLAEAVETAETAWVQSRWLKAEGMYTCDTPAEPVDEPVWPKRSWDEIFEASVKSRFIDSSDHPVVQRILHARI